jgi:hypothetical protein
MINYTFDLILHPPTHTHTFSSQNNIPPFYSGFSSKDWLLWNSAIVSIIYLVTLLYLGWKTNALILEQLESVANYKTWKKDSKKISDMIVYCHQVDPWKNQDLFWK